MMKRILTTALVAVALVTSIRAMAQEPPTAPAQTITIDGRQQYLSCLGEGSPTIVVDAGMGEWSLHWLGIQASLAATTRTCLYDRAGYGLSAMSDQPRTAEQIVGELHALLAAARIEPPYLLMGHSLGGAHMRFYAQRYPDQVAGLALIDSTPPDHALPEALQQLMAESYAQFPQLAALAAQGVMQPAQMPVPPYLPAELAAQYQQQIATEGFFATLYGEYQALAETMAQVNAVRDLGDLPLVVVAARRADDSVPAEMLPIMEAYQAEVWLPAQAALAQLSTRSRFIVAEHSRHHIQYDEPDVIVEAVGALFQEITAGR
ncbi:MAG: alpha/beta hydrolase [Anaerolineae bacterium]|nr:alpha/beta hydrolase [Anaerolineae bacterium]